MLIIIQFMIQSMNAKNAKTVLSVAVITAVSILVSSIGMAEAYGGATETIYSPSILESLNDIITNPPEQRIAVLEDGTTVTVDTTVKSSFNAHKIEYKVYLDDVYQSDQSNKVKVTVLSDNLYHVIDSEHNVLVTSDQTRDAARSVTVDSDAECTSSPTQFGHGRTSELTQCWPWMLGAATMTISASTETLAWNAPATMYYWFQTYTYDQSRINPHFATLNSFWTNQVLGSLSYSGYYSANSGYYSQVTMYYDLD